MKSHGRLRRILPAAIAALLLLGAGFPVSAGDDEESDEIPFSVAQIYFELNNTDGDLGIHSLIDGGPWKTLSIEMPDGRENLSIRLKSRLRRQGLTELFFESAEPPFEELDPKTFFRRFPEGEYEVEGTTLEGDELESSTLVTHLMPAPAANIAVDGELVPEDCDEGPVPAASDPVVVTWDPVTHSHPDLGRTNEPIVVERYQVVVEQEEPEPVKFTFDLPPGATSVQLPAGLFTLGQEIKLEVLTREASGNQTATETCFEFE